MNVSLCFWFWGGMPWPFIYILHLNLSAWVFVVSQLFVYNYIVFLFVFSAMYFFLNALLNLIFLSNILETLIMALFI